MNPLRNKKKAFTMIEMTVSVLIISVIVLTLIMVFRSNVVAWKWGQKHMGFNQKIQLVMKQIFTDIKNINPIVKQDKNGNIWFQGEKMGDLYPNIVSIFNKDGDKGNGGEELAFYLSDFTDFADLFDLLDLSDFLDLADFADFPALSDFVDLLDFADFPNFADFPDLSD